MRAFMSKMGLPKTWVGRPIFFGPAHFLKMDSSPKKWASNSFSPKNSNDIIQNCIWFQKWTAAHFKKWAGPKKIGRLAHFLGLPIFDMNALTEYKAQQFSFRVGNIWKSCSSTYTSHHYFLSLLCCTVQSFCWRELVCLSTSQTSSSLFDFMVTIFFLLNSIYVIYVISII